MKDISNSTYENLTISQRIIASIEAMARGDDEEKLRLIKTCPRKTYTQTDAKYGDTMEKLINLAIMVECELRGQALSFYIASWLSEREDKVYWEEKEKFIKNVHTITRAWNITLENMGIKPETMEQMMTGYKHPHIQFLQDIRCYEDEELEHLEEYLDAYKGLLGV